MAITSDARAYGVDVHRRSRALTGLLAEYPVAGALAVRCAQGLQRLYGFFAATVFHQYIQQRGSLADAFGVYLASHAFADHPAIAHMAEIERGIARGRRAPTLPNNQGKTLTQDVCLRLAPWVELCRSLTSSYHATVSGAITWPGMALVSLTRCSMQNTRCLLHRLCRRRRRYLCWW